MSLNKVITLLILSFFIFNSGLQSQSKVNSHHLKTLNRLEPANEGFAFNTTGTGSGNFIKFPLNSPGTQNVISPFTGHTFYGADFNHFNELYAIDAVSGNSPLYKIDTASGSAVLIGSSVIPAGQKISALTFDSTDNKWYAASTNGATSTLYIVNIETGGLIYIGNIAGAHSVVGISAAPNGTLFGIDNYSDSLIRINKLTAIPTNAGLLGIEIKTNIGMDFNNGTGVLYLTSNIPSTKLLTIDTTTGTAAIAGDITGAQFVTGFAIPFSGQVAPPPPNGLCQSFSTSDFPPTGWNVSIDNQYWVWDMTSAYCLGSGSSEYDFYDANPGTTEDLNSGIFSPANGSSDSLVMMEAYATYQGEDDQLVIKTSTDTGSVWTTLVTLHGGNSGELVTAPGTLDPFIPTCTQWQRLAFKLPAGTKRVQFEAISAFGNNLFLDSVCIAETPIGIHNITNDIPTGFSLHQNYPNPFNPETKITFEISKSSNVKLTIYNLLGEEIQVLTDKIMTPGVYNFKWNASSYPSGVYFYKLEAGSFNDTKKMVLIK